MGIRGQVDGMEGSYIVGWAVAEPDTGTCAITISDEAGNVVAKGRATRHRADLASLNLSRTSFAFRIPVRCTAERRVLHIRADGQELPHSPVTIGAGQFDGDATIEAGRVTGWVSERMAGFAPPEITVTDQHGRVVARGAARRDAGQADPLFAPARFSLELDDACFGAGELVLTLRAAGMPFARCNCTLTLRGNLETLTIRSCAGWLISPEAPERAFTIEIYQDGVAAGIALCEHDRDDVRKIYPGAKTPGFGHTWREPEAAIKPALISLRLAGAARDLFDGPYLITTQAAAIKAAERVARLAYLTADTLSPAERGVLTTAMTAYIARARTEPVMTAQRQAADWPAAAPQLTIIIPIYRDVSVTRACIESVLAHRNPARDRLILINDKSPDAGMAEMLGGYAHLPNVLLTANPRNLGFVQTVNRGMSLAGTSDVLLLNSDTRIFAGGLDEMVALAASHPEVATITALSNNATVFSYPHPDHAGAVLSDVTLEELAAITRAENAGRIVDVPTGHGFCMLIKGAVISRIGMFDERFGRGYGEENDFCMRAAALGYRNVAACGVLVEHRESVSFGPDRAALLAQNLTLLQSFYPEYTPVVMAFEAGDGMRAARWAMDRHRLTSAAAAGRQFVLVVSNGLEGGTLRAMSEIDEALGHDVADRLTLSCTDAGLFTLTCAQPLLLAHFTADELPDLFGMISAAAPKRVLVHQLLGFPAGFIEALTARAALAPTIFFAHDFYSFCPRVTMIDAIGRFCDVADAETCARCVEMGGSHETSRLTALSPADHRDMFGAFFGAVKQVVAPSQSAASYLKRAFPQAPVRALAHPEPLGGLPDAARAGDDLEITLLGAIGPHKGSAQLVELARRARLTHPQISFRVIGYTDRDKAFKSIGNVTITGKYTPEELPGLLAAAKGRLALFLSQWPETYSYTLSEAVRHGFIPLVPDIGAPAERVRAAGYGAVFPFPFDSQTVLGLFDAIAAGRALVSKPGAGPAGFFPDEGRAAALAAILTGPAPEPAPGQMPEPAPETKPKPAARKRSRAAE